MFNDIFSDEYSKTETHRFYEQEWSVFVCQVDKMTGGSPVARELFFNARRKNRASKAQSVQSVAKNSVDTKATVPLTW